MTKGFITLATGSERYYKMAINLLRSYQLFSADPLPFTIIADRHNCYTEQFDGVIILEDAKYSYLDKLSILINCPYDQTIFVDADCLAYQDLNKYWEEHDFSSILTCFGNSFPLDNKANGYFTKEGVGQFSDQIKFIPHVHGGVYFIRKNAECRKMYELALHINANYSSFEFNNFDKVPADEPIFALCMAIFDCRPIPEKGWHLIFYPTSKNFKTNILRGSNSCIKYGQFVKDGYLVHWQNFFTDKAIYKSETDKLNIMYESMLRFGQTRNNSLVISNIAGFTKFRLKLKLLTYIMADIYHNSIVLAKTILWHFIQACRTKKFYKLYGK